MGQGQARNSFECAESRITRAEDGRQVHGCENPDQIAVGHKDGGNVEEGRAASEQEEQRSGREAPSKGCGRTGTRNGIEAVWVTTSDNGWQASRIPEPLAGAQLIHV